MNFTYIRSNMFNLYGPISTHRYLNETHEYILHYLPSDKALYTFTRNLPERCEELLNNTTGWPYQPPTNQPYPPLYCTFNTLEDIPELFI